METALQVLGYAIRSIFSINLMSYSGYSITLGSFLLGLSLVGGTIYAIFYRK